MPDYSDADPNSGAVHGPLIKDMPQQVEQEKAPVESNIFRGLIESYGLEEEDGRIISQLFDSLLNGKDGIKATEILKTLAHDRTAAFSKLKRLIRLKSLGILQVSSRSDDDTNSADGVLRSTLQLSGEVLNSLFEDGNGQVLTAPATPKPYRNNLEYLADQFERIKTLGAESGISRRLKKVVGKRSSESAKSTGKELRSLEERIDQRLRLTETDFPFEAFKRQKKLSDKEELIVIALLRNEMLQKDYWEVDELLDLISESIYDRLVDRKLFEKSGRLVKEGMVEFVESDMFRRGREAQDIRLGAKLRRMFVGMTKRRLKGNTANGFFEIAKPKIALDNVVLPQGTLSGITLATSMIKGQTATCLHEWGFKHNLQAISGRKRQPVIMLFYGPPGTGKTLAANAMAYELKRSVLSLDCSKVLDKYVGESQKNTRMIFDTYRDMAKRTKNVPILLLNEADQLLQRRMSVRHSVDSMYNQMQNIILEQMEQFEGILIATTNLVEQLDPAFSRRFHYKIEFKRPGPEERIKLWRVHMPEKAPVSDDVNIEDLANIYAFTGGQIAVAVRNAAARAAMRGDRLIQEDLKAACEDELCGHFDEQPRQRIGF